MLVKSQSNSEMPSLAGLLYLLLSDADACQIPLLKVDVGCMLVRKKVYSTYILHFNFEVFCKKAHHPLSSGSDSILWSGSVTEIEDLGLKSEE